MTVNNYSNGKSVTLSKALDSRVKILSMIYFVAFTIMGIYILKFTLTNGIDGIGAVMFIVIFGGISLLKNVLTPRKNIKKKVPNDAKKMAKKRPLIETVIGINKTVLDLEHTRHRTANNAFVHTLAAMCAYSFYQRKPSVKITMPLQLNQPDLIKLAA